MDTAFVITWKVPFPGREKQALEFAAASEEFWGKQAAEGHCTPTEWFFLPNGTGMWMVKGARRALEELVATADVRRLLATGSLLLQDWQYMLAQTASGSETFMADYGAAGAELGIIS